jgi:hypothetical protein
MGAWINNEDNRRFITQVGFVMITLLLLWYLHMFNISGNYDELIVGIIGIFIGVASTASKDLISGESLNEMKILRERVNALEKKLAYADSEKELYKQIVTELHEKLVQQSGILNDFNKK